MIICVLSGISMIFALWVFFLAVMALKGARDTGKLTTPAKFLGYPILAIGYVLDIVANLTVMSILLLELPEEFVVTDRVTRHVQNSDGFRYQISKWLCTNLLDPFDPSGCHCR